MFITKEMHIDEFYFLYRSFPGMLESSWKSPPLQVWIVKKDLPSLCGKRMLILKKKI